MTVTTFREALRQWSSPEFEHALAMAIACMGVEELPLQQALQHGSHALADPIEVIIIEVLADTLGLDIRAGILYTSVIAGCQCADDPTPTSTAQEYCEIRLLIERDTGAANVIQLLA